MPCSMSQREIDYYEQDSNEKKFGFRLTDQDILEEVACQMARYLKKIDGVDDAPKLVRQWIKLHEKRDREA